MDRNEAYHLLTSYMKNKNLLKHSAACEAAMEELADHFGEDREVWGRAGLLHDIDFEIINGDMKRHAAEGAAVLAQHDVAPDIVHAVLAHNKKVPFESRLDRALYVTDPATGFIVACALMHPQKKLGALDADFLMKRFREKRFAAGANREQMQECVSLGLELEAFLNLILAGMRKRSEDLGL